MVLNIFPRRREAEPAAPQEPQSTLPEPAQALLDEPRPRRSRGSRGGRGRGRSGESGTVDEQPEAGLPAASDDAEQAPVVAPRARRPRKTAASAESTDGAEDTPPVTAESTIALVAEEPRPARRGRGRVQEEGATPEEARPSRTNGRQPKADAADGADIQALARAVERQGRQIEQLVESARRGGVGVPGATGAAPRVGIFVDSANVELACDRLRTRTRIDWGKVMALLTKNRQLVRAMAYSPVHDDPNVSIETQRFVEPFLDKGYKVVTKPLKRFQDGTIKANVDIELALDVVSMLDRLDVVCLVSGDGDFTKLIEYCQAQGVRVEVVSVGSATAAGLKYAADEFIDLQARMAEVRV
ncbi:MAG: NYN domain-containing protein [Dehalococcoidia bacterium]